MINVTTGDEVTNGEFTGVVIDEMDGMLKVLSLATGFFDYLPLAMITRTGNTFSLDGEEVRNAIRKVNTSRW